jgi:hypothetical protein
MRSIVKQAYDWLRSLPHPQAGLLIALHDGELPGDATATVRSHLERCSYCQQRLDRLLDGLRFIDRSSAFSSPIFSVEEGLASLTSAIHQGKVVRDDHPFVSPGKASVVLHRRLLSELSIYLGRGTATRLLERCNHSLQHRDRLSAAIEPVVKTFLGEDAGGAVLANVLRIWDTAHQVAGEGLAL